MEPAHVPVLAQEAVAALAINPMASTSTPPSGAAGTAA